jgi:flagellar biosynthesis regulator FlaF
MNVTRCAIPLSASAPLPSTGRIYIIYTSQVARIQSQLIASWVGEGETTANSLPNELPAQVISISGWSLPRVMVTSVLATFDVQ